MPGDMEIYQENLKVSYFFKKKIGLEAEAH